MLYFKIKPMKKVVFLLCAVFICFSTIAFSQDTLKTRARQWTTEVNFNPLQGQFSLNNAVKQIKVRYFVSDLVACRLGFSVSKSSKEDGQNSAYGTNPIATSDIRNSFSGGLNLGLEKHFKGTRRLSPYLGVEIALGYKKADQTIDTKETTTQIDGGWLYGNTISERGFKSAGINIVTGFDFYMAEHFYCGYEMLLGFNYTKYDDLVRSNTIKPDNLPGSITYPDQTSEESAFGPGIINGIRLGYTF